MSLEADSQKHSETDRAASPSEQHSYQSDPPMPLAPTGFQPPPTPPSHNAGAQKHDEPDWRKNVTLGVELIGLVVLIVYTSFAGCQWKVANETLKEIRNNKSDTDQIIEAMQDQAQAAGDMVDAANNFSDSADEINTHSADSVMAFQRLAGGTERAVIDAEARARTEDRPYISVVPRYAGVGVGPKGEQMSVAIVEAGRDTFVIQIAVDMKIKGRSPATEMAFSPSHIIVGPADQALEEAINYVPPYASGIGDTMLPDDVNTIGSEPDPVITKTQRDAIIGGEWQAYIVGGVRYRDVFKPRLDHPYEMVYCFQLRNVGMPFGTCLNKRYRRSQD